MKKYVNTVQLQHLICDILARKFLKQIKGHGDMQLANDAK